MKKCSDSNSAVSGAHHLIPLCLFSRYRVEETGEETLLTPEPIPEPDWADGIGTHHHRKSFEYKTGLVKCSGH